MGWWMSGGVDEDDKLDFAGTRRVLSRSFSMIGPYRRTAIVALVLMVCWTGASLAGPLLLRRAIDKGLRADDAAQLNLSIALFVLAAIAGYFCYGAAIRAIAKVGEGFLEDLRVRAFDALLGQSMPFYDREKAGVLVARMTADIDSLRDLVQLGLLMFAGSMLILTGSAALLFFLSPLLFAVCLATIPFLAIATVKFQRDSNRAYLAVRDRIGTTLTSLQEGINGVRIVQSFGRERQLIRAFSDTNYDLYRTHMRSVKIGAWYLPLVEFAGVATTAIAVGVGGWMVRDGRLTLGTVAAFILLLQSMFGPVQSLSQLFNLVQSATAALHKVFALIDEPVVVDDATDPQPLSVHGDIELRDVSFSYDGIDNVLTGVSLDIPDGERIAFVGPTGAGKSTLAKLIARFYDASEGSVRIGGVDVRHAATRALRDRVVVVPQEGFLFGGTIADNVRIARPDATDDEVAHALTRLGIAHVFEQLPDGIHTEVKERGSRLSAGEKQLVSLARAALVDPSVLILDEATSSVDPGTEALVEQAMEVLMADRTVIVIAHRLSTSERCDRVGVIADGHLAELGTHDDLVASGGHYADLYDAWLAGLR